MYSLGVTIWEIVTRAIPFADALDSDIPFMVKQDNIRPPLPDDCHAVFKELIEWCWHPEPEKRPTCAQLIEFVDKYDDEMMNPPQARFSQVTEEPVEQELPQVQSAQRTINYLSQLMGRPLFRVG